VIEIDRLGEELGCTKIVGTSSSLVIAIGGDHHHRQIGEVLFDLAQQLEAIHARHVDVRKDDDQLRLDLAGEPFERRFARVGEMKT
jgi:hypothetical protein